MKECVLLLNRFPYWVYKTSRYPFENVNLIILQEQGIKLDFPENSYKIVIECDISNHTELNSVVKNLHSQYKFSRVINNTERYMYAAANIRELCEIHNGLSVEETRRFRDKMYMKKILREKNIKVPEAEILRNRLEAVDFFEKNGKSIIKPVDGTGTKDTYQIDNLQDIESIKNHIFEGNFEIEKFIFGDMYHCDSVIENGKIVICSVSKYLNSTLNFNKDGYLGSVMIDQGDLQDRLLNFNEKVISALECENGVTHLEIFVQPDGELVFCEIAARPGGGGVIPSVENVYGIDISECSIRLQLGESLNITPKKDILSGWLIIHKKEGIVAEISPESEFDYDWITYKNINAKEGESLTSANSSISSIADFTIIGGTQEELINRMAYIRNKFKFSVEKVGSKRI